ncbi:peptidylprolyl isomerase [Sulfurimonas sp.]
MITWMQRHKKWLIITIWISTIAFVGAGFVGWGQYSYGDKAGAVAKVGKIEISMGELQKTYSSLYSQYNQMFKGNFDEEKAKQFGLKKEALKQLVQQALLLNLAKSYDLTISDKELFKQLTSQEAFFKDGVFDKETYKQVLSQNRLTTKEYEAAIKKELLIQKTLKLLPVKASKSEENILTTILSIADKLNYQVLSLDNIKIDTSDALVKTFWQSMSGNFMTDVVYDVKYITQKPINATYDEATLTKYYNENRTHFKDAQGKILPFAKAKDAVAAELNAKATKDKALRNYIAYKKGKLDTKEIKTVSLSKSQNPFNTQALEKISKASLTAPFLKPILINGVYYTFELVKVHPSQAKSYAQAKKEVLPIYESQTKRAKLLELANKSVENFTGKTTGFITVNDVDKLTKLSKQDAAEFLQKLFTTDKKRSFIALKNGKIVLYNVLEQKLLNNSNSNQSDIIARLKSTMFNEGLLKTLQNKYQTEIFIQGL